MKTAQNEEVLTHMVCLQIAINIGAPNGAWLQKDLAPWHAPKRSKTVKAELGFKMRPWMGQSPDLNPIESA